MSRLLDANHKRERPRIHGRLNFALYFVSESKRQSQRRGCPLPKKGEDFSFAKSNGNDWDSKLFNDYSTKRQTLNGRYYVALLDKVKINITERAIQL